MTQDYTVVFAVRITDAESSRVLLMDSKKEARRWIFANCDTNKKYEIVEFQSVEAEIIWDPAEDA